MREGKGTGTCGFIAGLAARMKENRKLELFVYAVLIAAGVILFAFSSCRSTTEHSDNTGAAVDGMDERETRLARALSLIEGAGEVKVMITSDKDGEIAGVIIIAQGAENLGISARLHAAAVTALGVNAESVGVYKMYNNTQEG